VPLLPRLPMIPAATPGVQKAVHALVIGVGHYQDTSITGLAAAAPSALAFADWLLTEHAPPGLVRGSIDVLASQPDGQSATWQGKALDPPTLANVQAAVDAFYQRVDADPASMTVFYFCGHGVESGALRGLLLEDVDRTSAVDPFRNAIAFEDFVAGMAGCGPRQQLYVLDACRELPLGLAKWVGSSVGLGQPLVRCNVQRRAQLGPRIQVTLEATSQTQRAWEGARAGWFTESLLTVLQGAAGDNRFTASEDEYAVNTRDIADVIKLLVQRGFIESPAGPQDPVRKGEGDLDFHVPPKPVVPILVTRRPPSTNVGARFDALKQAGLNLVATHTCADPNPWRSNLPLGDYVFQCNGGSVTARVSVPAKRVELP